MRLLVTGAGGMLGQRRRRAPREASGDEVLALARADLDITDERAVAAAMSDEHVPTR